MANKCYSTCNIKDFNNERDCDYESDVNAYSLYIKEIRKSKRLSREEETELLKKASAGDNKAKEKVIESHLKLVINIAKRFASKHSQLPDLISEGNIGLLVAADKFDLEKKASFATFATYSVLQNIVRATYKQSGMVTKPAYLWERTRRVDKIANNFINQTGREPTVEEISSVVGISSKVLGKLLEVRKNWSTYNNYVDIENLCDCEDGANDDPLDILVSKEEKDNARIKINQAISALSEREKQLIMMRFGLNGDPPMTLQDVGKKLNMTRQRVQQIEKRIVGKMRAAIGD